jgi:hypothetical protein
MSLYSTLELLFYLFICMCRANAYVALPVFNEFLMAKGLCLADLLEEKFEQDFLIRNKHVAAVRGHMDIQAMHFRDNERRKRRKVSTRRCDSFQYRFSHFRDLRVRTGFCDSSWVAAMQARFPDLVDTSSAEWTVFKTAGTNPTVTLGEDGGALVGGVIIVE